MFYNFQSSRCKKNLTWRLSVLSHHYYNPLVFNLNSKKITYYIPLCHYNFNCIIRFFNKYTEKVINPPLYQVIVR